MKEYFHFKTWIITFFIILVAFLISIGFFIGELNETINIARAGEGDNVSGYAWSEHYGWISFNSINCDVDGNGYIDTDIMTPGCGGDNISDIAHNYGVTINEATGALSGYAWSDNLGWINFSGVSYVAPNLIGFAQIESLGADGQLRMDDDDTGDEYDYGVYIDGDGEFHNWAWNDKIGWVSFNCADPDTGGCTGHDYKVITSSSAIIGKNQAPSVILEEETFGEPCDGLLEIRLNWLFSGPEEGDFQSAWLIQIDKAGGNFVDPIVGPNLNEWLNGGATTFNFNKLTYSDSLNYNQAYIYRVKVKDSEGLESDWAEGSFTTYEHKYPELSFTTVPASPRVDEEFALSGAGTWYDISNNSNPCQVGDELFCNFNWTLPATAILVEGNLNASSTIKVIYPAGLEDTTTRLTIEKDGYSCFDEHEIGFTLSLPDWQEVKP